MPERTESIASSTVLAEALARAGNFGRGGGSQPEDRLGGNPRMCPRERGSSGCYERSARFVEAEHVAREVLSLDPRNRIALELLRD